MAKLSFDFFCCHGFKLVALGLMVCLHLSCQDVDRVADGNRSESLTIEETTLHVTQPPSHLGLDPFYKKYLNADGFHIVGSEKVSDEAFPVAQDVLLHIFSKRQDVRDELRKTEFRLGILAQNERLTDLPEYREFTDRTVAGPYTWDVLRGLGGSFFAQPFTVTSEEDLLCNDATPSSIIIHELAHIIHLRGIRPIESSFESELFRLRDDALSRGLWQNTIVADPRIPSHYWTGGVERWFNVAGESIPANGSANHVNTREELKAYDPGLYHFVARYFPDDDWKPQCFK